MLCLLAFGEQEALLRDTPRLQNVNSASTEPPLFARTDPRDGRDTTLVAPPLGAANAVPASTW